MTTQDHGFTPVPDDSLWPRTPEYRYRLYTRIGTELTCLTACPTPGGIGEAIVAIHNDQRANGRRLADLGRIGVLDVIGNGRGAGDWIVLPWDRNFG